MITFFLKPVYPLGAYDHPIIPATRKKRKTFKIVKVENEIIAEPADVRILAESVLEIEKVRRINKRNKRAKEITLLLQMMEEEDG